MFKFLLANENESKATNGYQIGKSNRVAALDVAKAIGIFLVVLGHITHDVRVGTLIYSFHMPLFFFLSGVTANLNRNQFVSRKFRTLMVPYFIWAIVFLIYWLLVERKLREQDIATLVPVQGVFFGLCKGDFFISNVVLWFLPSLFCVECIAFFINKKVSLKKMPFILITLLVFHSLSWMVTRYTNGLSFPYCIETSFIALPFYLVGVYAQDYIAHFLMEKKSAILLPLFVASALMLFFCPRNPVDIRINIVGNYFLFYLEAFLGIICVISISTFFQKDRLSLMIGRSTLALMIFHDPLKRIVLTVASRLAHLPVNELRKSIPVSLILTIVIIALIIPVKLVVERFFPQSLGQIKLQLNKEMPE